MHAHLATTAAAIALSLAACAARGAEVDVFKDWAVACDQTRSCDADGFRAEGSDSLPVMLWISREAGPNTAVRGRLKVESATGEAGGTLKLVFGGTTLVEPDGADLPATEFAALLPKLLDGSSAQVLRGTERFTLSLAGLKAALLKMDDLQGRIGTPGALVRKGTHAEASVPPALPPFVPHPAAQPEPKSSDPALLATVLPTLDGPCSLPLGTGAQAADASVHRVSLDQVLVLRECERGAYQSMYAGWVVDDRPPYAARRLAFPFIDGPRALAPNAQWRGVTHGMLVSIDRGGPGDDCGGDALWTWSGAGLELFNAHVEPLCRGMKGGGMTMRTFAYTNAVR